MEKLIKLIKEKVIREGMTVDETIKYVLELKSEINIKEFIEKLKRRFCLEYEQTLDNCNLIKGCDNCNFINKLAGDKLI